MCRYLWGEEPERHERRESERGDMAQQATGDDGSRSEDGPDGGRGNPRKQTWDRIPEERRLAAEMRSAGRSVADIAEALDRDRSTVWRWSHRDAATQEYLRHLNDERRHLWSSLAQTATQRAFEAVIQAATFGDPETSVKWLSLVLRYELIGRDRLWPAQ